MKKTKTVYYWEGMNQQGLKLKGTIEASSVAFVKKELGTQAIRIKKIKRKTNFILNRKIKQVTISFFIRQLATMLKAGIPLIQSFDFVAKSQTNFQMKRLIEKLKNEVEQGQTLSEAFKKQPKFFNQLFCNLIATGEKSGKLDLMLDSLAAYRERIEAIKMKLKKVLAYPFIVLLITVFVTIALLLFVVPQFEDLFNSFGAELPSLTRTIIFISKHLKSYWLISLIGFSSFIYGFIIIRQRLPKLEYFCDQAILKLPILGPLFTKAIIARFARTLGLSFSAGLPIADSMSAVARVVDNQVYARAAKQIELSLFKGQQMNLAIRNTDLFPTMVVQMITIGEESGTLELMLQKIADFYEDELNANLDLAINLLEPIIMAILGLIIGTLVLAMYLPIFKLGSVI